MKKKLLTLTLVTLIVAALAGCNNVAPADVSVMALNGPTAMGMVQLMNESDTGEIKSNNFNFTIAKTIDEVTPKIVTGEVDIAAVPANVASVLYNNSDGAVKVLGINTLGVLYIVESGNSINSLEDLAGKTLYASGKGATPEYGLNYILEASGLTGEVNIEWKSEHSEVVAAMAADPTAIGMLPQPFATTVLMQNTDMKLSLNLTEEWEKLDNTGTLVMGVVVANADFLAENPEAVKDFMAKYKTSVDFINSNLEEGAALVGQYEIVPEQVALTAIPLCNITYMDGEEMKAMLSSYLQVLYDQNPNAVGGEMPDDAFYYLD